MDGHTASHGSSSPASSVDSDYFNGPDREVDLGQLFSDVSKTVGKFKNILSNDQSNPLSSNPIYDSIMNKDRENDSGSPLAKLFGSNSGVCFKTCGMEDIQFAARRAGEMFMTMKVCMIILTIAFILCIFALTMAILLYIYKNRNGLPLISKKCTDDTNSSFIFNKRNMPPLNQNIPKPPVHQLTHPETHLSSTTGGSD